MRVTSVSTQRRTARLGRTAPIFWPATDIHHVAAVPLDTPLLDGLLPIVPDLYVLAALADAINAIQTANGYALHQEALAGLLATSSEVLSRIERCDALSQEDSELMRMRAVALVKGHGFEEIALREAAHVGPSALTLICGPLCTLRQKTREPLHSVVAAVPNREGASLMERADSALEKALDEIRADLCIMELSVDQTYPLLVHDLVVCGGEANAFPKHFAYFLPEDENVSEAQVGKTISFANVYRARYENMSARLAQVLLDPAPLTNFEPERILLLWLRGHDVAHGLRVPQTCYSLWDNEIGREHYMMLQETLADVYGFLLALTPPWRAIGAYSEEQLCSVFLGEMMQYLRRGPWWHGDAGAACIELNFLATHGFIHVAPASGTIRWETDSLCRGMRALATVLVEKVLAAQISAEPLGVISRYGWRDGTTAASSVMHALQGDLAHVPTGLTYTGALS